MIRTLAAALVTTTCIAAFATPVLAQDRQYNIRAGSLKAALDSYIRLSGRQIVYRADEVRSVRTRGTHGQQSAEAALAFILAGTGFTVRVDGNLTAIVRMGNGEGSRLSPSGAAASAGARNGQSDDTEVTGEIIVTATKSRQRLIDVPTSVTAETGAQLRRRGATQLQDIVETTPGLSNPGPGGGNTTNLVIRGVTTDTSQSLKQSTVSVLFDDIPVDPATSGLLTTNLRIVDIERVEVLRGPQGTLFGSGAISGAVRYITNKPDATRISGSIDGSFAGTRTGANSKWGNVVVNLPLVTDRVAVRAVGYGFDDGGWVDNIRLNRSDVNRNKTYGGRIALAAQATDDLSVTLTGAYQDSRDYAGGESLYAQPAGYGGQVTNDQLATRTRAQSTLANVGLTYDFGGVALSSSSTYIRRKAQDFTNYSYYTDLLQLQFGLPSLNNETPGRTFNLANIFTQELRLASRGSGPFRWTFGGFYLNSKTPQGGQTITSPGVAPYLGTGNLVDFSTPGRQEEIAGFGEATYTVGDKLDLTAGVRVSQTTVDITSISSGLLITGGDDAVSFRSFERETAVNPRFSVLYHPTRQISLYAQAARGYRVGGANVTALLSGPNIPLTYGSDHLWNYETGIKANLMNGRLLINADVYYIDWKNLQVSLLANNFNYTGNAGAARLYGLELEVAAKPASWLDLGGSLTLNDAALTQNAPTLVRTSGIVGAIDGDRLPGSARVQGSAYAQLNFRYKDDAAYIRASGQYIGAAYTDFAAQGIRYGDYGTVDLRAGIVHQGVELSIFARNLLDGDGIRSATSGFSIGPIVGADQYAYRVRPRTIGLTGRVDF